MMRPRSPCRPVGERKGNRLPYLRSNRTLRRAQPASRWYAGKPDLDAVRRATISIPPACSFHGPMVRPSNLHVPSSLRGHDQDWFRVPHARSRLSGPSK